MKKICLGGFFLAFLSVSSSGLAEGTAVGARLGTLGFGVELTHSVGRDVNARIGYNYWTYNTSGTESDINYDIDLNLNSGEALLDWHAMGGRFRLTGGLLLNGNELSMTATPAAVVGTNWNIGGVDYDSTTVGTLKTKADFNDIAPYFGIGWGNAVEQGKEWGFNADIGFVYQGEPSVSISASGVVALADLTQERNDLQDALGDYTVYPVASVGISYQF